MTASLETLSKGDGTYSERQLKQIQRWLDEDWESHDYDANLTNIVRRLLTTIRAINGVTNGLVSVVRYAARQNCHKRNCGTACKCEPCMARKLIAIIDPEWRP